MRRDYEFDNELYMIIDMKKMIDRWNALNALMNRYTEGEV